MTALYFTTTILAMHSYINIRDIKEKEAVESWEDIAVRRKNIIILIIFIRDLMKKASFNYSSENGIFYDLFLSL